MDDWACRHCRDAKWVCELHPDSPAPHGDCHAAQMPCPNCNDTDSPEMPEGWRSYIYAPTIQPRCQRCGGTGWSVSCIQRCRSITSSRTDELARVAERGAMSRGVPARHSDLTSRSSF